MIEKENYILDEGFLGTKSLFTKQNKLMTKGKDGESTANSKGKKVRIYI